MPPCKQRCCPFRCTHISGEIRWRARQLRHLLRECAARARRSAIRDQLPRPLLNTERPLPPSPQNRCIQRDQTLQQNKWHNQ
eukprot:6205220-Pleurochrysis_carterae.AAC.1